MKTSLGIWAFGGMATRFNPGGYKPELSGISTAVKVRTAVEGLGELMDDYEFHYPWELSPANLDEVARGAGRAWHLLHRVRFASGSTFREGGVLLPGRQAARGRAAG